MLLSKTSPITIVTNDVGSNLISVTSGSDQSVAFSGPNTVVHDFKITGHQSNMARSKAMVMMVHFNTPKEYPLIVTR